MNIQTINHDAMNPVKTTKSFWQRTEGKAGMVTVGLLASAAVFIGGPVLITFMGILTGLIGQGLALGAMGLLAAGAVALVANKRVRVLTGVVFKNIMRKITGIVIELDPIGIMKSYVEDLKKKQEIMDNSISELSASLRNCTSRIEKNEEGYTTEMEKASAARSKGLEVLTNVSLRQADRHVQTNNKVLKPLARQMEGHLNLLRKFREGTEIVMKDLENEVAMQSETRDMILASYSAMNAAKSIIMGNGDARELYNQALEYTATDYNNKISAIDDFIHNSRSFMENLDLENEISINRAAKMLDEWEAKSKNLLSAPSVGEFDELSQGIGQGVVQSEKQKVSVH